MEVRPFTIHVPDDVLDNLRQRLSHTRFPDEIPASGWDYGSNLDYLKDLVHYWHTDFDWRAQEEKLNRLHHYKTPVDGLHIHFIHERGIGPNPMPLIMTHGWPSCFFEMTKILPLLTDPGHHGGDPADAFDMVVPSLPGFGFSDHPTERGMDVQRVAGLWNTLMTANLDYPRFAAQGGDIGAGVTARLGYAHADNLYGIHLTSMTRPTPYLGPDARPLTAAEQALIEQRARWQQAEGGYAHIQGTKPQTLAYGLNEFPAGLAAWIVEKYRTWSDCNGDVEARYTKDELLTIVTVLGDADHRLLHPDVSGESAHTVGDRERRKGPGSGGHGHVSPGNCPSAQGVGGAVVPCSTLGRNAQRRPLRRPGRTRIVGAGDPHLLSPVSLRCITGVCGVGTSTDGNGSSSAPANASRYGQSSYRPLEV